MNLCHNRYGKNAEYMVKCQQRLEFMRICRAIAIYRYSEKDEYLLSASRTAIYPWDSELPGAKHRTTSYKN